MDVIQSIYPNLIAPEGHILSIANENKPNAHLYQTRTPPHGIRNAEKCSSAIKP